MTAAPPAVTALDGGPSFVLPPELEAHEPPEERGAGRDDVRLLVSRSATGSVEPRRFDELPGLLLPGDLLVVNNSATLPASVVVDDALVVHFSTPRPDGRWLVEPRRRSGAASLPWDGPLETGVVALPGGAALHLEEPFSSRLWFARLDTAVGPYLRRYGRPIRYGYVGTAWPIERYQTVFGRLPGSVEMPSASRPFTERLVTRLVAGGVLVAPITLHTGVASPEAHEPPYAEPYEVPPVTARLVNLTRASGGRVIAVGTTAVRALETASGADGLAHPSAGYTETIITPECGLRLTDGLVTGLHEPRSSHLSMLAAFAGDELLTRCYQAALTGAFLWHEFGDLHLLLP